MTGTVEGLTCEVPVLLGAEQKGQANDVVA